MRQMIPLEEAQEIILQSTKTLTGETVPLQEAHGRILSEDIYAPIDLPPFDRSPLDGYAFRSGDTQGAGPDNPVALKILEEIPAGSLPTLEVVEGTASKILTGAPLPPGADAVIAYEKTRRQGDLVYLFSPLSPQSNIIRRGEDIPRGKKVLSQGDRIAAQGIGLLAALGISQVPVYRRPRVAILSTGDELVGLEGPLPPGKIRNSNLYTLEALVREAGGEPLSLGLARDRREDVAHLFRQGLQEADLVISTGGVSVGDYDVVKEAMEAAGAQLLFWKVAMKPGTPFVGALAGEKLVLGLSGNPAAAFITYELLVRPALEKLRGNLGWKRERVKARWIGTFASESKQRRFLRGQARWQGEYLEVGTAGGQKPGVMESLLHCNCLVDIPAGSPPLQSGQWVEVILW